MLIAVKIKQMSSLKIIIIFELSAQQNLQLQPVFFFVSAARIQLVRTRNQDVFFLPYYPLGIRKDSLYVVQLLR